jgi:hypothetical protein
VSAATLAAYVRHAEQYGGLRDCWEAARGDLDAIELGELAAELRRLATRTCRAGRKGRTVTVERFTLTRDETAVLIGRLIEAGVGDVDVFRYTGASQAVVETIRAELDETTRAPPSHAGALSLFPFLSGSSWGPPRGNAPGGHNPPVREAKQPDPQPHIRSRPHARQ